MSPRMPIEQMYQALFLSFHRRYHSEPWWVELDEQQAWDQGERFKKVSHVPQSPEVLAKMQAEPLFEEAMNTFRPVCCLIVLLS